MNDTWVWAGVECDVGVWREGVLWRTENEPDGALCRRLVQDAHLCQWASRLPQCCPRSAPPWSVPGTPSLATYSLLTAMCSGHSESLSCWMVPVALAGPWGLPEFPMESALFCECRKLSPTYHGKYPKHDGKGEQSPKKFPLISMSLGQALLPSKLVMI